MSEDGVKPESQARDSEQSEANQIPDSLLIKRWNNSRDQQAANALEKRYRGRIRNFLYRKLGNSEDAEDISQETWMHIYASLSRFEEDGSFSSWAFRIASNKYVDFQRQRGRQRRAIPTVSLDEPISDDEGHSLLDPASPAPGPEEETINAETMKRFYEVFKRCCDEKGIPSGHREAYYEHRGEGVSNSDIGKKYDLSPIQMSNLYSRMGNRIRKCLESSGYIWVKADPTIPTKEDINEPSSATEAVCVYSDSSGKLYYIEGEIERRDKP